MLCKLQEIIQQRKTTLKSFGALLSSQMLVTGLGGIGSFIQAGFIDPKVLGYFGSFALVTQYLTFFNIGWLATLQRDYPYLMGKGKPESAKKIVAVAESWIVLSSCLIGMLFIVLTIISLILCNYKAAAGWASQFIIAISTLYISFLNATYRSSNEFVTLSKVNAFSSIMSFLLLPLVAWLGFWGLCFRGVIPAIANGFILHRERPVRVAPQWDFHELLRLFKFGLAMDIGGYLATSGVAATMGVIVASYYGYAAWGLFVFALNGEVLVTQFSYTVIHIFVPRINQQMGMTENLRHCVYYSLKPMLAGSVVAVGLIVLVNIICEPLISFFAPKWIPCIPFLRVFIWGGIYPVLQLPVFALVAAKQTWQITISYIMTFVIFIFGGGLAIIMGWSPIFVVLAYITAKLGGMLIGLIMVWIKVQSIEAPNNDLMQTIE